MATRGRPLDVPTLRLLKRLRQELGIRATARAAGVARDTVRKYCRVVPSMQRAA
jgi:hypothetical protein